MLLLYNYYFKAVTRLNESINRSIWISHSGDATKAISVRLKRWRSRRRRRDNYSLIVAFFFFVASTLWRLSTTKIKSMAYTVVWKLDEK